ncbi:hypothetical protein [Breoghania sp.]|uniref:hypothetical protein n=1 Tax=Breoghania sp. TaxID=2065378 RepID=UPI0037481DC3
MRGVLIQSHPAAQGAQGDGRSRIDDIACRPQLNDTALLGPTFPCGGAAYPGLRDKAGGKGGSIVDERVSGEPESAVFAEDIRLVIWDMDDTFWHGTLEEGDVFIPESHARLIKELARRGIVSSICSKNDLSRVRERLEAEGLWDWFVFPAVAYTNKSGLVRTMLEQMGLRAPTALFIDDNAFNRGEVGELVDGINVASEHIIEHLFDHPQLRGKPDPDLARLERYRVLQEKQGEIAAADVKEDFLRSCEIKISFHFDIEANFERIHDLVNRTNQLNFTKNRWDPDLAVARAAYEKQVRTEHVRHAAYVKVRDRYGYYGICGFYEASRHNHLEHFLFSCRAMNMGVEQFVFQTLGFPSFKLAKPVAGALEREQLVDWISVVEDAGEDEAPAQKSDVLLCMHGPCEMAQSSHYLRPYMDLEEEFQYPRQGWGIMPLVRNVLLADELAQRRISSLKKLGLTRDFGGIDLTTLGSRFFSREVDAMVWSFSMEKKTGLYRNRRTGLVFPLSIVSFNQHDFTSYPYELIREHRPVKAGDYAQVARNFDKLTEEEYESVFAEDIKLLAGKVEALGRPLIVVEPFDNTDLIDRHAYRLARGLNKQIRSVFDGVANVSFIRFADCISSRDKEVSPNHFQRSCYLDLANLIRAEVSRLIAEGAIDPSRRVAPGVKANATGHGGLLRRIGAAIRRLSL